MEVGFPVTIINWGRGELREFAKAVTDTFVSNLIPVDYVTKDRWKTLLLSVMTGKLEHCYDLRLQLHNVSLVR